MEFTLKVEKASYVFKMKNYKILATWLRFSVVTMSATEIASLDFHSNRIPSPQLKLTWNRLRSQRAELQIIYLCWFPIEK